MIKEKVMKRYKNIVLFLGLIAFVLVSSCTDNFDNINSNPNSPEAVPTANIFNGAARLPVAHTFDEWWMGRMAMPWMQMGGQIINQEDDHYQYRETVTTNNWSDYYTSAQDFKSIIDLCEDPETADISSGSGDLDNQIAVSRIMLTWIFDQLTSAFGDVPYYSYGNDDPDFEALDPEILQPKFVSQEKIYPDMLKELGEAAAQIKTDEPGMSIDNIYHGDMSKWRKFANSLRLRIANRIKGVYPEAEGIISGLIDEGDLILQNEDNAIHEFGASTADANPFWASYIDRTDFEPGQTFVELLKGNRGNFDEVDPRLPKMIAPAGDAYATAVSNIPGSAYGTAQDAYEEEPYQALLNDHSLLDQYMGMPSGMPMSTDRSDGQDYVQRNSAIGKLSFFSYNIIKPDFGIVLMEAAETHFIIAENQNWAQGQYELGVERSLEQWGVEEDAIDHFVAQLPASNKENVLTQKYVALFMQPSEAWNDYRRTGFPKVLILPGEKGKDFEGFEYTMTAMRTGNVTPTDIPRRLRYPLGEQTLNIQSYEEAVDNLSNGDEVDSNLWWTIDGQ